MRDTVRVVAAAALLAVAGLLQPGAVREAAAVDCSQVYCATLEIVPSPGTGTGHITSDPAGIDCTSTPTSLTGTCVYQFSWAHFISGGIDVDLYLDPDPHSYACQSSTCGGLDQTLVRTQHLNPGDNLDYFLVFNLGNKTTVQLSTSGTGSGRVTTNPAGLDCRVVAGVKSGTCSYDYWYLGSSYSVTLHRTPDTGSYACSGSFCGMPDTDYVSTLNMSPGLSGPPAAFWLTVPVTVNVTGSGTVVSNPAGISCPPTCTKWFPPDTPPDDSTKLTATPAAGWYLKDWTGSACDATTGPTCTFYNGYAGATVGVVFASLATPAPSASAKPPATPKPTVRPTAAQATAPPTTAVPPSGAAPPSAASSSGPPPAAGSAAPPSPAVETNDPSADPAAPSAPDASAAPGTPNDGAASTPAETAVPLPSGSPASGGTDPIVLVLILIIAVLALALGFALGGRRRRDERTEGPTPPRA